jgi:phage terminase large subunit GpA-like protein
MLILAMALSLIDQTTATEIRQCLQSAKTREIRSRRQWCEQELVPAEGPLRNQLWRPESQPFQGLLLDEMDSGRWSRVFCTGCVQSGKSLICYVAPILYHLFEIQETTIAGTPTQDVNHDKWDKEIKPVILSSPGIRGLLPRSGPGSRDGIGNLESIKFCHGPELKFMSAGGGDEKRSSYTARVVVMTELDKMDQAGEASRETDPVSQMEARANSWDILERQTYGECTVSIEKGRIWQEYSKGTASKIACPCPHCRQYVTPEREHFQGWQQATSELEAIRLAHFVCPACAHAISDAERREMNLRAKLVHRGQSIAADGTISGPLPDTLTLGFRWSAFNNLLWSSGTIGVKEWKAIRAEDNEAAERELVQFTWVIPHVPAAVDETPLDPSKLSQRMQDPGKGVVPEDTQALVCHVDIGKRVSYWMAMAWRADGRGHVVDYGKFDVAGDEMDIARAVLLALRDFREEVIEKGFSVENSDDRKIPAQVWIDARYKSQGIFAFCQESGPRFKASMGCGVGPQYSRRYARPGKTNKKVRLVGEEYHVVWFAEERAWVVEVNADYWKSWGHRRLATPVLDEEGKAQPGAMTLFYSTDRNQHLALSKHLTAEKEVEEFVQGIGLVRKWVRDSRSNHWLDTFYNCCAMGHFLGVRLIKPPPSAPRPQPQAPPPSQFSSGGRAFLISERKP